MCAEPALEGEFGEQLVGENRSAQRLEPGFVERLDDGKLQPLADAHMRCISSGFNKRMKIFVDIALKGKSHGVT